MKVNPLGIQSYQSPNTARPQTEQKPTVAKSTDATIVVTPQPEGAPSTLAVKATPADYGSLLTEPERKAMEALFARFKDTGRTGLSSGSESERGLGQIVDIKV
jgi:hypothetical protein